MDWIAIIEREGDALSKAAGEDTTAMVPACPGWDVRKLLGHCTAVHRLATDVLRSSSLERPRFETNPSNADLEWFGEGVTGLLSALREGDPSEPAWTFCDANRTKSFWFRRQAHETSVHRVDAEQAVGIEATVDADFAVDGIDELLTTYAPLIVKHASIEPGGMVHVHTTDVESEWLLDFDRAGPTVERGHGEADSVIRGPAAHIYLWLWGRRPIDGLDILGDDSLAAKLRRATTA